MLFVLKKEVNGVDEYMVVECENHRGVMQQDRLELFINEDGKPDIKGKDNEVAYIGIYEVGQTNLLQEISDKMDVHKYYSQKLRSIGIDPITFERIDS